MCGRFNLTTPQEVQARFGFVDWHERRLPPRFNIAPSQEVLTIVHPMPGSARALMARWGLQPAADTRGDTRPAGRRPAPINARAESLAASRLFRACQRCLIPATGFYEWQGEARTPMHICLQKGGLFAFAGLWAPGTHGAPPSMAIVTVAANALVAPIHQRMPAILRAEHEEIWLDPALPLARALDLLGPYPAEEMRAYPVSPRVNAWANDTPEVLDPAEPAEPAPPAEPRPVTLPLF